MEEPCSKKSPGSCATLIHYEIEEVCGPLDRESAWQTKVHGAQDSTAREIRQSVILAVHVKYRTLPAPEDTNMRSTRVHWACIFKARKWSMKAKTSELRLIS
jgi:hypothetical protein